jgi:hypothetical protein
MPPDRRRSVRLECDLGALWRRGKISSIVRVRSVSVHGLWIDTPERIEPNYLFELVILLPGSAVSLLAVSRNAGPRGVGASIHAIDPPDHWKLVSHYWTLREHPIVPARSEPLRSAG